MTSEMIENKMNSLSKTKTSQGNSVWIRNIIAEVLMFPFVI